MYIILDTQAIHHDFYLSYSATNRLLEEASARGWVVCVPEVVVQEMVADYREQMGSTLHAVDKHLRDLARLRAIAPATEPAGDLDAEVLAYETRLRALLEEQNVLVLPIPATTAATLFERNRDHRKPFKSDGRGLNDALLWESVLELRQKGDRPIALITGDNDFAEPRVEPVVLHSDLQDDLDQIGLKDFHEGFNAELHKSIGAFVQKYVNAEDDGRTSTEGLHQSEGGRGSEFAF